MVDWYSAKPFEVVQIDLKHIRDQKALSKQQIAHLDRYNRYCKLNCVNPGKCINFIDEKETQNESRHKITVTGEYR